ncbi:hypothetical protein [Actibacterium sp. 188UL27-1]|uniref:hypothetical protein n=1 Tax=Actibacterium sp. 188UL27-1 TaxID=2786961 RepID=UPI001958A119|nr:hypothetical protein [Actibacterium sp. 188UL27-1]MBM7067068.1 hypothetical protein [Actibacterium sp. 188UL27-1]
MRPYIQFIYATLLRLQAGCAAVLCLAFLTCLPGAVREGAALKGPLLLNGAALLVCVVILAPNLVPTWVKRPGHFVHAAGMILGHWALTSLFLSAATASIVSLGLDETPSRVITTGAASILGGSGAALMLTGLILSVWTSDHHLDRHTPYALDAVPIPHDPMELRALRRSGLG